MKKTKEINQYLKNVWHDIKEYPTFIKEGSVIAFICKEKDDPVLSKVSDIGSFEYWANYYLPIKWAYFSDLCPTAPNLKDYKSIKTYEDACEVLGERVDEEKLSDAGVPKHIIALMKLELVCKALWGGEVKVYPDAEGSRIYYYPRFWLFTKDEISSMSSKDRGSLLSATTHYGASASWGSVTTYSCSSHSTMHGGFRLCLDTKEKAMYFGKQFVELWAEYLAYNFTTGERLK